MVDIDEIVVSAATKYLRGICYDSMDQLVGDNYEVFYLIKKLKIKFKK